MFILSKLIDKRIAAYQKDLIGIHYAEVENMYNQIRGWKHDYAHHVGVLKSHAAAGEIENIKAYLNELDKDLKAVDMIVKTGNKMTDAILNSKVSLARARNINVIADASIAVELRTSQLDLCIILGNLLDNAIEANAALPEKDRIIRIFMEMKNIMLYISITNAAEKGKKKKFAGKFKTTKGSGHGFGLVRIDDIIERNSGYISRNSEDGVYSTEILLPQE